MEVAILVFVLLAGALVLIFIRDRRTRGNEPSAFSSPTSQRPEQGDADDGKPAVEDGTPLAGWGSRESEAAPEPQSRPAPPAVVQPPPPPAEQPPEPASVARPSGPTADTEAPLDDALDLDLSKAFGGATGPDSSSVPSAPEPARFSAYYPKEAAANSWLTLRAYVFRLSAASAVEADAAEALKDRLSEYRPVSGDATVPLADGALITATPELPGFQFNPPSASIAFYENWQALAFKLRATSAPLEQAANGRITFNVEGVIVADLPISVFVTAQPAAGGLPSSASADPYDSIFCSYSHRDTAIVERVERAYKALGMAYLRDVTTLRSGEEWNPRLLALIEEADIFQLFWSTASSGSRYVRQEWEYALSLNRGGPFIRPVYWEQPMPNAPAALGHLHFHFDPALRDSR